MDKQIWMGKLLILALLVPLTLYIKTLLPTVAFWDTGEFQTIAYTLDVAHPTGYPTYLVIGKIFVSLFPFGSIAWRMNLLSALFVSTGLFIFALLVKKITNSNLLGILSSFLLATNPYLWSVAIRADPHALHFLFTTIFLLLTFDCIKEKNKNLFTALSFITGLSLGNHMISVFFVPPLIITGLYLIKEMGLKQTYKTVTVSVTMFLVGISIYALLPIISLSKPPLTTEYSVSNLENLKRHVFGEDFQGLMKTWSKGNYKDTFIFYFSLIQKSLPMYSWVFIILGVIISFLRKSVFSVVLHFTFIGTVLFGLTYQNAVIERYFIPSFAIGVIWFSLAFSYLYQKHKTVLLSLAIAIFMISLSAQNILLNYEKIDASHDVYPREWGIETFQNTKQNGVVFSWWSYSTPLWYLQKIEDMRPDVTIINSGMENWENKALEYLDSNAVYFIQEINLQNPNLKLIKSGSLYELRRS